jgi:starch phosphorylase
MWQPVFGSATSDEVPITHVTNGVHVPTWLSPPMRSLFDRHFGDGWLARAHDPETWAAVDGIDDAELWAARCDARRHLVERSRQWATQDRLRRGEDIGYASAAATGFDPDRLTVGFARRLATYKRLYLLSLRPERALALLSGDRPLQFVFAGKAHPLDEGAKLIVRDLFRLKGSPAVAGSVAFLEDYDLRFAPELVAGCDVWVNVLRPPEEASGTSGMKAAVNGGLNLSVLDGWWAEAYDGTNGWAIDGEVDPDAEAQDQRHADALLDTLEHEVVPLFHDRDGTGLPTRWLAMVRASLKTNGPQFSATRMVREYATRIYPS